jgi:hypothetical protein
MKIKTDIRAGQNTASASATGVVTGGTVSVSNPSTVTNTGTFGTAIGNQNFGAQAGAVGIGAIDFS